MEHLPVETIGNILSQIGNAREALIASTTCKKWRKAWRNHLHTLFFYWDDWYVYRGFTTYRFEMIITQTILQTTGLQCLLILTREDREFYAASVTAWLIYTRDTLRKLHYNYRTSPSINILEICNRKKLEELDLRYNAIASVDPGYLKFPALKSLWLSFVTISVLDLSLLLTACPKLESLYLIHMDIAISDEKATMKLTSASLKDLYVESISTFKKFILDADSLERLSLKECTLEVFELVGKGSLRDLQINSVSVVNFDIGENTDNLEGIDVYNFTITWRKLYHIISRSLKLKRLSLWDVNCEDGYGFEHLETTTLCYPRLSKLSLSYDWRFGKLFYGWQGPSNLKNVTVLELGWTMNNDLFSNWVVGLLEMCPRLKKLVVYGTVAQVQAVEDFQFLADFTKSIVGLMRKYMHIDVQFVYQ